MVILHKRDESKDVAEGKAYLRIPLVATESMVTMPKRKPQHKFQKQLSSNRDPNRVLGTPLTYVMRGDS